jgi:hypothetical protein
MKAICFFLFLLLSWCAPTAWAADDVASNEGPGKDLDAALGHIIRLLEGGEIKTFIETYAHPDDLKKIQERESIDKLVEGFKKEKAEKLLVLFKALKGTKPELKDEGKTATYQVPEAVKGEDAPKRPLVFVLVGDRWYIRN